MLSQGVLEDVLESLRSEGKLTGPDPLRSRQDMADSRDYLPKDRLITVKLHPMCSESPEHRHNYIEMVYSCTGRITHLVNGSAITMEPGELLLMSQNARHEVCMTQEGDIALNFIILPEFFTTTLSMLGEAPTGLRSFLVDCLFDQTMGPGYLYFRVAEDTQIQNLMENLILTLCGTKRNRRKISQLTMTLLFLEILYHAEAMEQGETENRTQQVLEYVENHYVDGSLAEVAALLHCNVTTLSREIHRKTGRTYTQLVQERRLEQAALLLRSTDWTVERIARSVGYENISYFHRLFQKSFGHSPRQHRLEEGL